MFWLRKKSFFFSCPIHRIALRDRIVVQTILFNDISFFFFFLMNVNFLILCEGKYCIQIYWNSFCNAKFSLFAENSFQFKNVDWNVWYGFLPEKLSNLLSFSENIWLTIYFWIIPLEILKWNRKSFKVHCDSRRKINIVQVQYAT